LAPNKDYVLPEAVFFGRRLGGGLFPWHRLLSALGQRKQHWVGVSFLGGRQLSEGAKEDPFPLKGFALIV
jgi:hypothetical protein